MTKVQAITRSSGLLCIGLLLISCGGKKAPVTYNAQFAKEHKVVIDDTLLIKGLDDAYFADLELKTGNHKVAIDDKPVQQFNVPDEGGILNFANDEFVIFPIKFTFGKEAWGGTKGFPNAIVIDTLLIGSDIYFKIFGSTLTQSKADSVRRGFGRKGSLQKTERNSLFISKSWDIGINEVIPQSVSTEVSKSTTQSTTYRTKVLESSKFLQYINEWSIGILAVPVSSLPE